MPGVRQRRHYAVPRAELPAAFWVALTDRLDKLRPECGAAALAFTRRWPHSRCNEPAENRPHDRIVVAIPARFAASRLPGKPLRPLGGEPLVLHVARRALQAGAREVWVATDDQRI